ncbi:M48 family metalloprotease [Streptomyces thermoalcalitolerans]|uniref:Peptidase M48 domain-containing protein n=1 Tax=Streptomyces thermoalcalitolerans TaxID=65605 RepID=A0ABN1NWF3_9ACTN
MIRPEGTITPGVPYPAAAPHHSGIASPPYPGGAAAGFTAGPPAPLAHPAPPSPAPHPPVAPPKPPAPGTPPLPAIAPDDLDYRHLGSRINVAAHQRGADATAVGQLMVHLPGALVSAVLVFAVGLAMGGTAVAWLVLLAWLAAGGLVFHRPTELLFARRVLGLRPPTPEEWARLAPVWREVTARAGIEAHTYELLVENSEELNAVAAAGHVVGVTTYTLREIPSSNLAAVLAHELGHHIGGHAWAGLLGHWYALPGRIAWWVTKFLAGVLVLVASRISVMVTGVLVLFMGMVAVAALVSAWFVTIPLLLAPYLLAFAGRKGELRADQQAAELGFAPKMVEVLHFLQAQQEAERARAAAAGKRLKKPGALARLLSTHPEPHDRIRALEPYLRVGL